MHFPYMNFTVAACIGVAFVYFLPDIKEMFEEIQEGSSFQHSDESGDPEGEGVALLSAD